MSPILAAMLMTNRVLLPIWHLPLVWLLWQLLVLLLLPYKIHMAAVVLHRTMVTVHAQVIHVMIIQIVAALIAVAVVVIPIVIDLAHIVVAVIDIILDIAVQDIAIVAKVIRLLLKKGKNVVSKEVY